MYIEVALTLASDTNNNGVIAREIRIRPNSSRDLERMEDKKNILETKTIQATTIKQVISS